MAGLTNVTAIDAGGIHGLALKADGTVWSWGDNDYGELGDGTTTASTTPVQVSGLANVIAVVAGDIHSVALEADGTVWTWGYNGQGQLGDGTTTTRTSPVQVTDPGDASGYLTHVIAVAGGYYHTVALKDDGTVWAWGNGTYRATGQRFSCQQLRSRPGCGSGRCQRLPLQCDVPFRCRPSHPCPQNRHIGLGLGE